MLCFVLRGCAGGGRAGVMCPPLHPDESTACPPAVLHQPSPTNAPEHEADIAKVEEWLGHANISTMRLYDKRHTRPEDSQVLRNQTQNGRTRDAKGGKGKHGSKR
jgi:hypothetical protein